MKSDIILAGVGGQGILSIATILGAAALSDNLYLKQAEVHGMSQRGGDVMSCLRLSSRPISSDLIPQGKADIIISLEPMEALRYISLLSPEGWIVSSTVLRGAAARFIDLPAEKIEGGIRTVFSRKGEKLVEQNIAAFRAGYERAEGLIS